MFAILLIPLLGMMAFAIDTGYMCLARTQLHNAADAAALAGAQQLQTYFVQYNLPGQTQQQQIINSAMVSAKTMAKTFAVANKAGGVNIQLQDADITFGFLDANGNYMTPAPAFPNTVSVVARRDGIINGPLALFFGGILGSRSVNLAAPARATIYTGDISNLQVTNFNALVLPVALDVNVWKTFYQTGKSPDGNLYPGPNGAWQLQIYPVPKNAPGNFSLIDIGPPANDAGTFRNWIDYGMSPSDVRYLLTYGFLPVSPTAPEQWKAGPGMTSTLVSNFADVVGKPNMIPLFQPVSVNPYQPASNTGQGATYALIGFASAMVSQVSGSGSNLNLSIQPAGMMDSSSIITSSAPAGTQNSSYFGTSLTTFVAPKLTY